MGIVSPVGSGIADFWRSLCAGRSGMREITRFDTTGFSCRRGGEIPDFAPSPDLTEKVADLDPATLFMLSAAQEAVRHAGLDGPATPASDAGVVLGTNFGGIASGEKVLAAVTGNGRARAADFAEYGFQTCADHVAAHWGMTGPRTVLSLSCASGAAALAFGADLIRAGRAAIVLTGGYDALTPFVWSGLNALHTMTRDEVRPFDRNRSGTLFGEGAGALVIEDMQQARSRGATVYAELAGYALNNNAHHMTAPAPEGRGSAAVLRAALADAGVGPSDIDHFNAHGTATRHNDVTEAQALHAALGERASRIPVTSIKSMTGHMMGAAGSAEAVASILSIRTGTIPPTAHTRDLDPDCAVNCVTGTALRARVRTVLSNSAGIGGCNAAVIFRETQD